MEHSWITYSHTPDGNSPARDCPKCHHHGHGKWYLDHTMNIWLLDWDKAPECRSDHWDLSHALHGQRHPELN